MLIPSGLKVTLAPGNEVEITHRLGGNFTIRGVFGTARVEAQDSEVLWIDGEAEENTETAPSAPETKAAKDGADGKAEATTNATEVNAPEVKAEELWEVARTVYDPELPVNIVDLGLVYKLDIVKTAEGKNEIEADMTLTAPGCSMGPMIADDLRMRLEAVPGVSRASVNIVWDPPWNQDMMSEEARMILGLA